MVWNPFSSSSSQDNSKNTEASQDAFVSDYLKNIDQTTLNNSNSIKFEKEKFEIQQTSKNEIKAQSPTSTRRESSSKETSNADESGLSEMQRNVELIQKEGYVQMLKERKTRIKEMALENCNDLEISYRDCFQNGSYMEKVSLCFDKYNDFWKCVTSQKKLLDQLNYGAASNSPQKDRILADAALDVLLNPPKDDEVKNE